MRKLYRYEGQVKSFNNILIDKWIGETMAETPRKAKSNLIYRVKKELGLVSTSKVSLPGKIKEIV